MITNFTLERDEYVGVVPARQQFGIFKTFGFYLKLKESITSFASDSSFKNYADTKLVFSELLQLSLLDLKTFIKSVRKFDGQLNYVDNTENHFFSYLFTPTANATGMYINVTYNSFDYNYFTDHILVKHQYKTVGNFSSFEECVAALEVYCLERLSNRFNPGYFK